jgi:hypothetical protein
MERILFAIDPALGNFRRDTTPAFLWTTMIAAVVILGIALRSMKPTTN